MNLKKLKPYQFQAPRLIYIPTDVTKRGEVVKPMETYFSLRNFSLSASLAGLSAGSPVTSPLKNLGSLFQKKDEDESKGLPRSKTGKAIF